MNEQSWKRLATACEFYSQFGKFRYRNVQWAVPPEIVDITKPKELAHFYINDASLVGSAEQSFLSEYEKLTDEKYYALTPCFRDEVDYEGFHHPYFMKLELFSKDDSNLIFFKDAALAFFHMITPFQIKNKLTEVRFDEDNYDIMLGNIELGSYSRRYHNDMVWVCGTGLAEPRFTEALEFYKNEFNNKI